MTNPDKRSPGRVQPIITNPMPTPRKNTQEILSRLAANRVPRARRAIRVLGNLHAYQPTPAQVEAIISNVREELDLVHRRLLGKVEKPSFALPTEAP